MKQLVISLISLGGVGFLFGVILSILDAKLSVAEDPLVEEIIGSLPGINCGACGFAGCAAYAKEVAKKKDILGGCIPGGNAVNEKVSSLLGVEATSVATLKAVVLCGSRSGEKKNSFDYKGPKSCAFSHISLGNSDCRYGCLGLGDCVSVCPVQALQVDNGLAVVDCQKCIGCGKCVLACPRNILQLVEAEGNPLYVVSCSNPEAGLSTKKVCSRGCIGCGICVKLIKDSPFYLTEDLSRIDYKKSKQTPLVQLDTVVNKCPVKIIRKIDV